MRIVLHAILFILLGSIMPYRVSAQSETDATNPATIVNLPGGFDFYAWQNPAAAGTSNNTYAFINVGGEYNGWSDPLQATNFGFSIPAGATITGIEVQVEKKAEDTYVYDQGMRLLINNILSGNDKSNLSVLWPSTDAVWSYGGADDTWGLALTPGMVNDINFGVSMGCKVIGTGPAYIDAIAIIVYYEPAPPPVGIALSSDGSSPHTSAILELKSSSQGFLLPRMSTLSRNSIGNPTAGLMIYDNTLNKPCYYNGSGWFAVSGAAGAPQPQMNGNKPADINRLMETLNEQQKEIEALKSVNAEQRTRLEKLEGTVSKITGK